ncbi:MAG: type I-E CRISPR-associated protein Cse2/CasB [Myxococcales bacterium]
MSEADAAAGESPSLSSVVNQLAGLMAHGGGVLTAGEVAGLRRMDPRRIDAPGFYKLVGAVLDPRLARGAAARQAQEEAWAAVIVGLAHLGSRHKPGVRLGTALVQAGFSELRFVRLLRADGDRLIDDIPALARFLAAKNTPADFAEGARLILSADRSDEETTRRRIAGDFYSALSQSKHNA